jgi:hypothetical protein
MNRFQLSFSPFLLILFNLIPFSSSSAQDYEITYKTSSLQLTYNGKQRTLSELASRVIVKKSPSGVTVDLDDYFTSPPLESDVGTYDVTLDAQNGTSLTIRYEVTPLPINISYATSEIETGVQFTLVNDSFTFNPRPFATSTQSQDEVEQEWRIELLKGTPVVNQTADIPGDVGKFSLDAGSLLSAHNNYKFQDVINGQFERTKKVVNLQPYVDGVDINYNETISLYFIAPPSPSDFIDNFTSFQYLISKDDKVVTNIPVDVKNFSTSSTSYDQGKLLKAGSGYEVSIIAQHKDFKIESTPSFFDVFKVSRPLLDTNELESKLNELTIFSKEPISLPKTHDVTGESITWKVISGGTISDFSFVPDGSVSTTVKLSYTIPETENYKESDEPLNPYTIKPGTFNLKMFPEFLSVSVKNGDEFDPYDPKHYDRIPSGFESIFKDSPTVAFNFEISSIYGHGSTVRTTFPPNLIYDISHSDELLIIEIQIRSANLTSPSSSVQRVVRFNTIDESVYLGTQPTATSDPLPSSLLRNPSKITLWGSGDNAPKKLPDTDDWYEAEWLGLYYRTAVNHIYHLELGWLYIPEEYKDSNPVWAYSYLLDANGDELGWLYFGARTPTNGDTMDRYIGRYNEENKSVNWLWYMGALINRPLFFDYNTHEYLETSLP